MIHQFATRHQKKGALILLTIFYLELVLPNVANALSNKKYSPVINTGYEANTSTWNDPSLNNGLEATKENARINSGKKFSPQKTDKANIGGPGQPEMSSFKSVNSNDMVDLFTGDFSYNIPLMDVGGYPVNLHYSSNVSMDQEASWVGLGWNINPGAINRSMRGLPDDFDGTDSISKTQNIKENRTVGVNVGAGVELAGYPLNLSASYGIFHNTYNGWGIENGINASINSGIGSKGSLTAGLGLSNNSQSGLTISPSLSVKLGTQDNYENGRSITLGLSTNYNTRAGISALQLNTEFRSVKKQSDDGRTNALAGFGTGYPYAGISFAVQSYTPTITMPYTSTQYFFRGKLGTEHYALHPSGIIEGYVSSQQIKASDTTQKIPAVGYLYSTNTNDRSNVLQDFNREKELPFNEKSTPHLAIPQYTYDVYSISGEGIGGMFRPYRGDVGYVKDYTVRTRSASDRASIDLGFGQIFHGGVDFSVTNTITENNAWVLQNDLNQYIRFQQSDSTYQSVYFRNPGEMTCNSVTYYQSIGDDNLLRVALTGDRDNVRASNTFAAFKNGAKISEIPVTSAIVKKERDKRSQVISYLTATDASIYALDKSILSYKENTTPINGCSDTITVIPRVDGVIRKKNHLSEITVLNGDGRRYIYGLPAYNIEQKDVTFSIGKNTNSQDLSKGLVGYAKDIDNSTNNQQGKEGLFTKEVVPAHAHSFLLTGIVSPDYVDIKGDGITQDDIGDAIKFNYTRVYGDNGNYFSWRTPADSLKANYNEGLKTYSRDDKASYIFGKKEVWYLNSIESKTMIAVFKIANDRKDIYSVRDENGGLDKTKPLRRLKEIDLYSKSDLVKNGINAKAIKTVHFAYSYSLCKGVAGDASLGKLTLDSVWFTYNGNEKGKLNPYVFKYHQDDASYNPGYHPKNYDRWGNFKDASTNPGGLNNSDYPFAEQNRSNADKYAQAWTMDEILLPSGGRIKATYEADDYAYVQNRRAQQFFSIAGISSSQASTSGSQLYSSGDNDYVFVNSSVTLANRQDLYEKYLRGINYLYFKLAVTMPNTDKWGSGDELIPVYAQIDDYGLVNSTKFWIKLKPVEGEGALARSAIQFLRLNLPSKAYPSSEPGDNIRFSDAVKMAAGSFSEIMNAVKGFGGEARSKHWCQNITLSQSFIRLNCPTYKKLGGGLRVKRIEVWDNWNRMTGQKESVYGQNYSYTTTEKINGQNVETSSGVASYEPMIGAEENPFREPIPYAEKLAPMAPVNNLFSEEPLGESYYPSASIGYSKVRVRTINTRARSTNGWAETEFFTTREFPTIVENTIIDPTSKKRYNPGLQNFLKINSIHYLTLSQGFKIELNDMSGKMKAQASYAETDSIHPISYTRNFYKVDNDTAFQKHLNNTVWIVDSLNGHINKDGIIGKDIELMQDMREQTSRTVANNISPNIDILPGFGIIPFIPIPSIWPFPQKEENRFRSAVTVKVIQRYGILDSVVVMDKGSIVSTKNLLYDGETGQVVLSRTNNEFNDPVYNFSYAAHWAYSGMGMAYKNIDAVFNNLKLIKGKLYYGGGSAIPFPVEKFFESGDEVEIKGVYKTVQNAPNCFQFDTPPFPFPSTDVPFIGKAWVIDAAKAKETDKGLYFIDQDGRVITAAVSLIRVLRSGKRNMLDASAGSIVSLQNPIKEVTNGNYRLVIDSTIGVINTSAVTYKDHWKVENSFYGKDTIYRVLRNAPALYLTPHVVTKKLYIQGTGTEIEDSYKDPSEFMTACYGRIRSTTCAKSGRYYSKSIATYDGLNTIPANAIITSAFINFYPRVPLNFWTKFRIKGGITCTANYSYDWSLATNFHYQTSLSYLRRITTPWNDYTKYRSVQTTEANKIAVDYNNYQNLNCTSLIQDIVSSGQNYGLVLETRKQDTTANVTETNYLSFDGGDGSVIPEVGYSQGPSLTINYKTYQDSVATLCKQNISDTLTNPYRWGIVGNWRVDRAYTYYHERVEGDASVTSTNIRKEGVLKAFTPFWKFTDTVLLPDADTVKWVWNSVSSLYNKKGFEIENYDPLGRYNAGLYGYDQTLPVAVAQNSKYRQVLYDGFEDYYYKTKQCLTCPNDREVDFVKNHLGVSVDSSQSHTGNYSMKVMANSEAYFSANVLPFDVLDSVSLQVDSSAVYKTIVNGQGHGLSGYYWGYPSYSCNTFFPTGVRSFRATVQNQGPIDYSWGVLPPLSGMCNSSYLVTWRGSIQAPYSDNYHFYATSDRSVVVFVNGVRVVNGTRPNVEASGLAIYLQQGNLYNIEVQYLHTTGNAFVRLKWARDNTSSGIEVVPPQFLYKDSITTADTVGSVISNLSHWCITPHNAAATNSIRPKFSVLADDRMVISGWVKMDGNDCNSAPALDNVLVATLNTTGGASQVSLQRTGVRIEGWQRYEATVTIPWNCTSIKLSALAPPGRSIYVDDIRVQPYNSQMKSYAYDQSTLRLMAELDENNYATFYEYDDDGTLIRVKKETERGVMTVKETRSALLKN